MSQGCIAAAGGRSFDERVYDSCEFFVVRRRQSAAFRHVWNDRHFNLWKKQSSSLEVIGGKDDPFTQSWALDWLCPK